MNKIQLLVTFDSVLIPKPVSFSEFWSMRQLFVEQLICYYDATLLLCKTNEEVYHIEKCLCLLYTNISSFHILCLFYTNSRPVARKFCWGFSWRKSRPFPTAAIQPTTAQEQLMSLYFMVCAGLVNPSIDHVYSWNIHKNPQSKLIYHFKTIIN